MSQYSSTLYKFTDLYVLTCFQMQRQAGPGYATLAREGPKESMGSVGHPDGCTSAQRRCKM